MKISTVLAPVVLALTLSAPSARAALIEGYDFPTGSMAFADRVVSYTAGTGFFGITFCQAPEMALGLPSETTKYCGTGVPLGFGGQLVLEFLDTLLTPSGNALPDLHVFEHGAETEDIQIAISADLTNWIEVGTLVGQTDGIDIDAYEYGHDDSVFRFVRLTDIGTPTGNPSSFAGAEVSGVGVRSALALQNPSPIPLPASGVALLLGLAALVRLRPSVKSG